MYQIHLPQFEGPFDLLLFFIERDELDIHDIPISRITNDFLAYIQAMERMDIEVAAEFILVASTLMRIKAKMLLPRPVLNEEGEEVDPREELVRRLLEYKRYKAVLDDFKQMEEAESMKFVRGYAKKEEKKLMTLSDYAEEELMGVDLYTIMKAFKRVWEKHQYELQKPKHVIRKYPYTVEQVKEDILRRVSVAGKTDFIALFQANRDKVYVVFCFLSILELVQMRKIRLVVGEGFNNFWINAEVS